MSGLVGHDRIQQAEAGESIGEAIRRWYNQPPGDFERIDVDIQIADDKLYLAPVKCKYAGRARAREIQKPEFPLSFNSRLQSQLWRQQLQSVRKEHPEMWQWSMEELCRIASVHITDTRPPHVQEQDLLRASGPLKVLGIELGPYVGKGYDCESQVQFLQYPPYEVPIEIKKVSSRFKYQQRRYGPEELSRGVVLCARHDMINVPANIDVIELEALSGMRGM